MSHVFKDAITICKTIMRNGYDAHIVNTALQKELIVASGEKQIDIATDIPVAELAKLFSIREADASSKTMGTMYDAENNITYLFYRMHFSETAHPEEILTRLTPTILQRMSKQGPLPSSLLNGMKSLLPASADKRQGFVDFADGFIRLEGLPDETLRTDYLLGIRALRYSANYELSIEPNSWIAIVRAAQRILDYVPTQKIMMEWRKVEAESMWKFVQLLFDAQIMHGFIPEIAALSKVVQTKNDTGVEESVLAHTIDSMRYYPEGELHYDWFGTLAMLFHDVGKLHTAEYYEGKWCFYEHHRVGAEITRKILRGLHMAPEDIELISHLVRNHMRFSFMMTDRGIRRFKTQDDHHRLVEMSRANIKARNDNYTAFNHNNKYLARAEMPEQMLEPLLNGNEIMEVTGLKPGPHVGDIRQALLKAQIAGTVNNLEDAVNFVKSYAKAHL